MDFVQVASGVSTRTAFCRDDQFDAALHVVVRVRWIGIGADIATLRDRFEDTKWVRIGD